MQYCPTNSYLNHRSRIVLAGACHGEEIKGYKQLYRTGRPFIYALEPSPKTCKGLRARWGDDPDVEILEIAAWIRGGTLPFNVYKSFRGNSVYERGPKYGWKKEVEVPCLDFAEFLKGLGELDVVRLNIEGAEYEVILHCLEQNALDKVAYLSIACHGHKIEGLKDLHSRMLTELRKWDPKSKHYRLYGKGGEKCRIN